MSLDLCGRSYMLEGAGMHDQSVHMGQTTHITHSLAARYNNDPGVHVVDCLHD